MSPYVLVTGMQCGNTLKDGRGFPTILVHPRLIQSLDASWQTAVLMNIEDFL